MDTAGRSSAPRADSRRPALPRISTRPALVVTFRRILVATDFAESAERALVYATQLARCHSAELILLHVYMDLPAYPEITAGQVEAIYEEQRRWIEDALERRARSARGEGLLARAMLRTGPELPRSLQGGVGRTGGRTATAGGQTVTNFPLRTCVIATG